MWCYSVIPGRLSWAKLKASILITKTEKQISLGSTEKATLESTVQFRVIQEARVTEPTLPHLGNNLPCTPGQHVKGPGGWFSEWPKPQPRSAGFSHGSPPCQMWSLELEGVRSSLGSPAVNSITVFWRSCVHVWLHHAPVSAPGLCRPLD